MAGSRSVATGYAHCRVPVAAAGAPFLPLYQDYFGRRFQCLREHLFTFSGRPHDNMVVPTPPIGKPPPTTWRLQPARDFPLQAPRPFPMLGSTRQASFWDPEPTAQPQVCKGPNVLFSNPKERTRSIPWRGWGHFITHSSAAAGQDTVEACKQGD